MQKSFGKIPNLYATFALNETALETFFEASYNTADLIDVMIIIGDKITSNYLHNITQIPVDWPEVPKI